MIHSRVLACVLTLAAAAAPPALAQEHTEAAETESCKCRPERVGPCFSIRGSISVYSRAPIVRIAVAGSKRVLGLEGGIPEWLDEDLDAPGKVVSGDFVVCPITRPKTGTIQLVCVESSSNLVVTYTR